ncbi:hypothetical protein [Planotetraspora kaengkrachanensis]|uniref:Uncharacterized protein n=1 Tax=Planotetraspora kaengkrachanensis TaxID=575193 RepID=A0A8J3PXU8_9ACTN|nr:hypothetical protein [Planotetraspora kaengkrachanensis]GIG82878.1 hypothetical protein Pka01_60050 [Planotetraspora kaengkrachanensis]
MSTPSISPSDSASRPPSAVAGGRPPDGSTAPGPARRAGWVGHAAVAWTAAYGVVALVWTLTGRGYPFGHAGVLRVITPEVGAPLLAATLLAAAVAALAMAGRHAVRLSGVPRALLAGFGYLVAAVLLAVVPSSNALALTGYAPMLILGAPFGWPPDVDYSRVLSWTMANEIWCMAGGYLLWFAVLSWQRRSRGACVRCGRRAGTDDHARIVAWGRRATLVAVVVPLLYAASRLSWLAGVPLGISDEMLRSLRDSGGVWAGAGLGAFAVVGAILTLGLIQRWGEVFPRWMIGLAGRRVPIRLAVIPALYVAPIAVSAGLDIATSSTIWNVDGYSPFLVVTHLLWPLWGVALAFAAHAYHLRRRGACTACVQGTPQPAGLTNPDS